MGLSTATSYAADMQAGCCHGALFDAGGLAQHLDAHVGASLLGLYCSECPAMATRYMKMQRQSCDTSGYPVQR